MLHLRLISRVIHGYEKRGWEKVIRESIQISVHSFGFLLKFLFPNQPGWIYFSSFLYPYTQWAGQNDQKRALVEGGKVTRQFTNLLIRPKGLRIDQTLNYDRKC